MRRYESSSRRASQRTWFPTPLRWYPRFPLTRTNKVDRRALASLEINGTALPAVRFGPRDAVEEMLVAIWVEVLRCPGLGVHDDFFALGGNSLNATQVIARLRAIAGIEVPLRALFTTPTIAGLAQVIRERWRPDAEGEAPLHAHADRGRRATVILAGAHVVPAAADPGWHRVQHGRSGSARWSPRSRRAVGARCTTDGPPCEPADDFRHGRRRASSAACIPRGSISLIERDLRHLPPDERLPAARELAAGLATHPFDLERGPLWWVLLAQLDEEQHVLAVGLHHTVGDLWSFGVIGRDYPSVRARVRHADAGLRGNTCSTRTSRAGSVSRSMAIALTGSSTYWKAQLAGVSPLDLADRSSTPADPDIPGRAVPGLAVA